MIQVDLFNTAVDGNPGYVFYEDAGHGWLKVSRKELEDLYIDTLISHHSYAHNDYVYLEEDGDLKTYLKARELVGDAGAAWWDANVQRQHSNRSTIRNYESFKPDMEKFKKQYGIPATATEIKVTPYRCKLNHSELAVHTGNAGKTITRLWQHPSEHYGYVLLHDNSFCHGALTTHEDGSISLS